MSNIAGTQYPVRFAVPPSQVEFPEPAIDAGVDDAFTPVFPKKSCRCATRPPGATIGSAFELCDS